MADGDGGHDNSAVVNDDQCWWGTGMIWNFALRSKELKVANIRLGEIDYGQEIHIELQCPLFKALQTEQMFFQVDLGYRDQRTGCVKVENTTVFCGT